MNKITLVALLALSVSSARSQSAQTANAPSAPPPEYGTLELLETWGWLLAENFNLGGLEISEDELDAISRGMKIYVKGDEAPTNLQFSAPQMQTYFISREANIKARQLKENKAEGQAFFDSLWGKPNYQSLATGLYFEILKEGEGPTPKLSDVVEVHYRGTFLDGKEFDSSFKSGQPARFKLDAVIPGWKQGLQQINKGGKIKIFVPSDLGYGDEGSPGVPPASTLIFEVELLNIFSGTVATPLPSAPVIPAQ